MVSSRPESRREDVYRDVRRELEAGRRDMLDYELAHPLVARMSAEKNAEQDRSDADPAHPGSLAALLLR